ncbi:MAG: hypothetical protein NPIRA04_25970 [Nitrospirales bacterium]|nr:MAG: hypothetical protein NPIRA04_25970 [Nitrospirales bacterium]
MLDGIESARMTLKDYLAALSVIANLMNAIDVLRQGLGKKHPEVAPSMNGHRQYHSVYYIGITNNYNLLSIPEIAN